LAPVQWEFGYPDRIEYQTASRRGRLDELLLADDSDLLGHRADLQGDRQVQFVGHAENDAFPARRLETAGADRDGVCSRLKIRQRVDTFVIRLSFLGEVSVRFCGLNRSFGNRRPLGVGDLAKDRGAIFLPPNQIQASG